jgi:hypothetical protein
MKNEVPQVCDNRSDYKGYQKCANKINEQTLDVHFGSSGTHHSAPLGVIVRSPGRSAPSENFIPDSFPIGDTRHHYQY